MSAKKTYDLFVTHAWRYHHDWTKICELLDHSPGLAWRNFSLPWHDPAMNPNSPVGGVFIRDFLETQIIPVHGVIFLAGVYAVKSARHWLDLEIELARKHNKPVIAIPPIGETAVADEVSVLSDKTAGWHADELIAALDQVRSLPRYSRAV
jgi:hypothetical protein